MPFDMPDTPSVVDDLYTLLQSEGFEVVEDRRGGIGGLQVILRGPEMEPAGGPRAEAQISVDRGHWTIGLRFTGMSRFIDPRVWAAHLDGGEIGPPDVEEQARFVAGRLLEAGHAVRADADIETKLVRMGEHHMRSRLGLE